MSPFSRRSRRPSLLPGCLIALAAAITLPLVAWFVIGGIDGVTVLMAGKNPFRYASPTRERLDSTKSNAAEIIAALERWKASHGKYPESLDELSPSELKEIPPSTIGDRRWHYTRPETNRFVLDFWEGPIYEHSWWDSDAATWQGDH